MSFSFDTHSTRTGLAPTAPRRTRSSMMYQPRCILSPLHRGDRRSSWRWHPHCSPVATHADTMTDRRSPIRPSNGLYQHHRWASPLARPCRHCRADGLRLFRRAEPRISSAKQRSTHGSSERSGWRYMSPSDCSARTVFPMTIDAWFALLRSCSLCGRLSEVLCMRMPGTGSCCAPLHAVHAGLPCLASTVHIKRFSARRCFPVELQRSDNISIHLKHRPGSIAVN